MPDVNVAAWQKWFKAQSLLCIPFKANGVLSNKAGDSDDEEEKEQKPEGGKDKLMAVLFKYARKFMEKRDQETITVGVVGFPNVGKSSVINVLKNKAVVNSGSSSFITQKI